MNTETSFGVIPVQKETREYLIIQSTEGLWGFPKGHPEGDETPLQTALREFTEETGITECEIVSEKTFIEKYVFDRNGVSTNKINEFYVGIVSNSQLRIQKEELNDARWVSYEVALKTLSFPEVVKVLVDVNEYLYGNKN